MRDYLLDTTNQTLTTGKAEGKYTESLMSQMCYPVSGAGQLGNKFKYIFFLFFQDFKIRRSKVQSRYNVKILNVSMMLHTM